MTGAGRQAERKARLEAAGGLRLTVILAPKAGTSLRAACAALDVTPQEAIRAFAATVMPAALARMQAGARRAAKAAPASGSK